MLGDTRCANGHEWHFFKGETHLGASNHAAPGDHANCEVVSAPPPMPEGTPVYAYGRTADQGPASRLKNVEPNVKAAEREIEKAKGILHGLVREMEMVAKHTHDQTIQHNFKAVSDFAKRMDAIDDSMDKFITDLEHFQRGFR